MFTPFHWTPQQVSCSLCGSAKHTTIFKGDAHGLGLCLAACNRCGFLFFNPRPSASDYDRFYREDYHRLYPSRLAFNSSKFGRQITTATAQLRAVAYSAYLKPGDRVLEIGPGDGAFLLQLKKKIQDCEIVGVDPSPLEVDVCRAQGLVVHQGYLQDMPSSERFTHVAAFHVLEHALDPVALLMQIAERLDDNGQLFVEVPNILGSWRGLGMLHVAHPNHFSAETLSYAVQQAGFEVIEIETLESPLLESSLRLVASKRDNPHSRPHTVAHPQALKALIAERVGPIRAQQRRFFAKRIAFRALGQTLGTRVWEYSTGRQWDAAVREIQKTHSESQCVSQ